MMGVRIRNNIAITINMINGLEDFLIDESDMPYLNFFLLATKAMIAMIMSNNAIPNPAVTTINGVLSIPKILSFDEGVTEGVTEGVSEVVGGVVDWSILII